MRLPFLIFALIVTQLMKMNAQDFEVSPVFMNFNAEPGQTQSLPITIINHSNAISAFTIILKDFVINKEGVSIEMPAASTEHSLVNWISINPPFLELNPNEARQVIVSIQSPVGDYSTKWANILVRSTKEQTALLADKEVQTGMSVLGQITIIAYQSPKSNVNYKMKISGLSEVTNLNDSLRRFKANVNNIGDKITDCKVTLLASDLSTAQETVLQVRSFKSFPDTEREIKFEFSKALLPPGKYALAAVLDYGKQSNLEGTQILLTVE